MASPRSPTEPPRPARPPLAPGAPRFRSPPPSLPGAHFDEATADAAAAFFPDYCRLTADEFAGHPFDLQPWQTLIIREAFGWRRADGTRLYRRVLIWIPRKNGKTELLGGVSHLCLLGDGVHGAECYSIASHGDQAEIVFNVAQQMVAYSPTLAAEYEVFAGSLYARQTHGLFKALTGKPTGKHGLKTTYLLGDEVHEWSSDRLYTYVRQAMASRREPMEWLISTAGVEDGYGVQLWEESRQICDGVYDDPETLVCIWCADPDDPDIDARIEDPALWAEANPNLGISLRPEYMAKAAREAAQIPARLNDFKRYHLNLWTSQVERWLPADAWAACNAGGPDRWRELAAECAGRACWGGLDLASTRDINALVWVFPPDETCDRWIVLPRFWWPARALREAAKKSRVPFPQWVQDGAIIETDGNVADHDAIHAQVLDDCALFRVLGLAIDQFGAHSIALALKADGVPIHLVRFAMLSMSGATKHFERLVMEADLDHGGHPVLRWMAANCAIRRDANDNYMPAKKGSFGKIDGIAASVMGVALAGSVVPEPESYLAAGGLAVAR